MKTIDQSAIQYIDHKGIGTGTNLTTLNVTAAFAAGVEFAQQWTDVNVELPEPEAQVLVRFDSEDEDKVYFGDYQYAITERSSVTGEWRTDFPISHWRYIELKVEK